MLSRLLKIWLIVSILGYGMALAADVHGELAAEDTSLSANTLDNSADPTDDSGCNHCAHGISHLLGLYFDNSIPVLRTGSILLNSFQLSWYSFSPPSLLRPPIFS